MRWLACWFVLVVACVRSDTVRCGDLTCPGGTECEPVLQLCLLPDQKIVCVRDHLQEGEHCSIAGFEGLCQTSANLCLPGCGDTVIAADEECDDGNFASHDGCSSGCLVEIPSWEEEPDAWQAVNAHVAVFHAELQRLVMIGGMDRHGIRTAQWQRSNGGAIGVPSDGWRDETSEIGLLPPARHNAMVAYDPTNKALVLFGGIDGSGVRGDTWVYTDANNPVNPYTGVWSERLPISSPLPRGEGVMAYHAGRQRVVLFGGRAGSTVYGDTWEYDVALSTWTQVAIGASPPSRNLAAMTYDSGRDELVLFGGFAAGVLGDTWTYDGTWTNRGTAGPGPRLGMSMAYLPRTDRVVMVGGALGDLTGRTDTWEYSAGTWTRITTPTSSNPPARARAAFAYDPDVISGAGSGALVLIGGAPIQGAELLKDVWQYDGTDWKNITPTFSPVPRYGPMAYRPFAKEAVIAGGFGPGGLKYDVWAYLGKNLWAGLNNETFVEDASTDHALAYDPRRDRVVLFGGNNTARTRELRRGPGPDLWTTILGSWDANALGRDRPGLAWNAHIDKLVMFGGERQGVAVADTWEYDGATWQPFAAPGPRATAGPALAWDYDHRQLVLFDAGGTTWIHEDHGWVEHISYDAATTPIGRSEGAFAYDWVRQRLVLAGGVAADGAQLSDVWELDVASKTWEQLYVPPGGPLPRSRFGFAGHRSTRTLLLYGGLAGGGPTGDTWHLQFRSATPDEDCDQEGIDVGDKDNDLQPDGRDPDCGEREHCSDTNDNDRDGLTDLADPECQLWVTAP